MRNLYYVPVTQAHLDAGQRDTLPGPARSVGLIRQEERIVARAALATLRALDEPVNAVYAGVASAIVALEEGEELEYCWCDDGIALMAACDAGRAAELQPQTVLLMDLPTYQAYRSDHPHS